MQDDMIDAALRQPPEVHVPPHFANRVLARLPHTHSEPPERYWVMPALSLALGATLASLGWAAISLGFPHWLTQPSVLAALLGLEAGASVAWIWRLFRSTP